MAKVFPTGKLAWYIEFGRVGVFQKGKWAVEVYFPYIRINRTNLFVEIDTALRVNWGGKSVGFMILGFGIAATLEPNLRRITRNDGRCWHNVSLNRVCKECQKFVEDKKERERRKVENE